MIVLSKADSLSISTTAMGVRVRAPPRRPVVDENPATGDDGEKASAEKSAATSANTRYFVCCVMIESK